MTLTELSERIGITQDDPLSLRTGKEKAIRFSTLEAICRQLNCGPDDLRGICGGAGGLRQAKEWPSLGKATLLPPGYLYKTLQFREATNAQGLRLRCRMP